jgi:hypothetical protein
MRVGQVQSGAGFRWLRTKRRWRFGVVDWQNNAALDTLTPLRPGCIEFGANWKKDAELTTEKPANMPAQCACAGPSHTLLDCTGLQQD